ncbi:LysR family transcriptional regulator [Vogesella amnigena]|uniref:LysR family transcriptional regulator n=1 Tax=Vogesella amnigena TaxID=1507449 RepID=A0ABV7TWW7_9NEIS
MLDDLALFVSIVESGSLSAAARKAGMPAATLTRRLQRLEAELGCRLLHRSARQLVPSSEGWQYYERCRPLLASLQQATEALDVSLNHVAGKVRVLAPVTLASGVLQPAWAGFMQRYPDISLDLQLSNQREDLIGSGADLAIRVGPLPDSQLNQRLLGRAPTVLVAAPSYLAQHGWPQLPQDLAAHALLLAEPLMEWRLQHRSSGEWVQLPPPAQTRLRVNEIKLAVDLACDGLGILYCPLSQAHQALADGRLQRVLPEWRGDARDIYAVWPQQRLLPARVRALLDYLIDFTAGHPLFSGEAP